MRSAFINTVRTAACVCGLLATLAATGCTTGGVSGVARVQQPGVRHAAADAADLEGRVVIRAQSVTENAEGPLHPLGAGVHSQNLGPTVNPLHRDHLPHTDFGTAVYNKMHNTRVAYFDNSTPVCNGTPGVYDPMCPTCPGGMGAGHFGGQLGGACPTGRCGHGCGGACIRNYHSYRVEQPKNLVYPNAGAVGGAVVYPYYTHKGPSDFFRDDPSNRNVPR